MSSILVNLDSLIIVIAAGLGAYRCSVQPWARAHVVYLTFALVCLYAPRIAWQYVTGGGVYETAMAIRDIELVLAGIVCAFTTPVLVIHSWNLWRFR